MPHWRDHFNSSLLGAYSLYDDKTDGFRTVDGLIIRCKQEEHLLGQGGKQKILVAYTSLHSKKPMKINVKIAKVIALVAKTQNPERWVSVPVQFYVEYNVSTKDGPVDALRVRPVKQQLPPTHEAQLRACKSLDELQAVYSSAGFPRTELVHVKDEIKAKLTPKP